MKMNKLFNVLVLGGAVFASVNGAANEALEAGIPNAFCTSENECKEALSCTDKGDVIRKLVPKDGIVCCWNTSCADLEDND